MKNLTTYLSIITLGIFLVGCSKDDNDGINERLALSDLAGKVLVSEHNDGTLISWFFKAGPNNSVTSYWFNKDREGSGSNLVLENNNTISLYEGELTLLLTKEANGKLTLNKFVYNSLPVRRAVLYEVSETTSFLGLTYKENDASYIGFADDKWGWSSSTNGIVYTSYFDLLEGGFVSWKSTNNANQSYFGVNIPAGVQWNGQAGPLMLVDRTGFTKPSIYKPL